MKPFQSAYLAPLAVLAALAGCSAGDDASGQASAQTAVVADAVQLEGVRFDVRRDPG